MKLEILEDTDKAMRFVVSGTSVVMMNSLRRTLMTEVPKLAIEDVDFHLGQIVDEGGKEYESITPLFNEIIAHRLGLIPLPTDLSVMNLRSECKCEGEGCSLCTVMYKLDKRGPCMVYSGDLIPLSDMKFAPKSDLIPIVKLGDGHAVLIYATAELGTGEMHTKWCPTCGVGYKYYPVIEVNNKKLKDPEACVEVCPRQVFDAIKGGVEVARPLDCNLCRLCEETAGKEAVRLKPDRMKFVFQFESDTSMTPEDIFLYALRRLQARFEEVQKLLGEALGEKEKEEKEPKEKETKGKEPKEKETKEEKKKKKD